jgi:hypothetical protein
MIEHQGNFLWIIAGFYACGMNWWICPRGKAGSVFDNFDCDFRAIGLGEPRFVLEPGGHRAIADFVRVAEFVELEQLGRQRFATGVALTLVLVDVYSQFSGHRRRSPGFAPIGRALCFRGDYSDAWVCSPARKSSLDLILRCEFSTTYSRRRPDSRPKDGVAYARLRPGDPVSAEACD